MRTSTVEGLGSRPYTLAADTLAKRVLQIRVVDGSLVADDGRTPGEEVWDLLDQLTAGRPAWHADALCREHPEVNFFPGPSVPAAPAKAVCARCVVREECLAWALKQGADLAGVWGGASSIDRRRLRRRQDAA